MADKNKRVLVISDLHIPYHHEDAFRFLKAVRDFYEPTRTINVGDEADYHDISFHGSDPDLMSAGDELIATQKYCKKLQKIFPEMDLVHSNHGSLAYRRAMAEGLPRHFFKEYNEILEVHDGWNWHAELRFKSGNHEIIVRHQFSANVLKAAQELGMSCVQGHYHSKFEIAYTSSPIALNWGMTVGCLIDSDALAFAYNKLQLKRPIIGVGFIEEGIPSLIPMLLNKNGRWVGKL